MIRKDDRHQIMVMIWILIPVDFMQKPVKQAAVRVIVQSLLLIRQSVQMFVLIRGMCDHVMDVVGEVHKTVTENTGAVN